MEQIQEQDKKDNSKKEVKLMRIFIKIILFLLIFLFVGCTNNQSQNPQIVNVTNSAETKTPATSIPQVSNNTSDDKTKDNNILINELTNGEKGKFYLGMTKDNVLSTLKSMKIDITNETEITSDEKSWDWGNKVLDAGDFSFIFDKNHILYQIDGYRPTMLGLKLGDSLNTMEKLYGEKHTLYQTDVGVAYEYIFGNHYFIVFFEDGKVTEWGISNYKYDK